MPFLISCSSTSDSTGTSSNPSTQTQTTTFTSEDKVFEVFASGADNPKDKYDLGWFSRNDMSSSQNYVEYGNFLKQDQSTPRIYV